MTDIRPNPIPATSPTIRKVLTENPRLPELLRSLDALQGSQREEALLHALGVHRSQMTGNKYDKPIEVDEDMLALRSLTEAIEAAVRGEKSGTLDLDWGE